LAQSTFTVLTGKAVITPLGQPPITLTPDSAVTISGDASGGVQAGPVVTVTQKQSSEILQESETGVTVTEEANQEQTADAQTEEAAQLASVVVEASTGETVTTSSETEQTKEETAEESETTSTEQTTETVETTTTEPTTETTTASTTPTTDSILETTIATTPIACWPKASPGKIKNEEKTRIPRREQLKFIVDPLVNSWLITTENESFLYGIGPAVKSLVHVIPSFNFQSQLTPAAIPYASRCYTTESRGGR